MPNHPLVSLHLVVSHPAGSMTPVLQSLGSQTWSQFQIVLVDNASQDRKEPWPRGAGPEIMVLRNFRDQGFARAHNQALTSLFARWDPSTWSERYIILTSSRIIFAPEALTHLLEALERNPTLMAVAPKVRQARVESQEESDEPGLIDSECLEQMGVMLGRKQEPRARGQAEKDTGQYDEVAPDLLSTWCVAIRASALMATKVGEEWLDEDLPESYALADLAWRLKILQIPTQLIPSALVWVRTGSNKRLGWLGRVRRWYGQESLQARRERSYAVVLRCKNIAFSTMIKALPWLFVQGLTRFMMTFLDPRVIPALIRSRLAVIRALRKRQFLKLAIQRSRR